MKVSPQHDGEREETVAQIVMRKIQETVNGKIYWGYSSTACRPDWVQQFANDCVRTSGSCFVLMSPCPGGKAKPPKKANANSYSTQRYGSPSELPPGVRVGGKDFALILRGIRSARFGIHLTDYVIDAGPSRGKPADEYFLGSTPMACIAKRELPGNDRRYFVNIDYVAELTSPFAVWLQREVE
jgi:hypothetical protein